MYLLKLALRPWRRAPLSQLFSSLAVGVLLMLIGFLFSIQHGLQSVVTRLQGEQVVTAYLDRSVDQKGETRILDTIRVATKAERIAPEIKLVDASQFISLIKSQYPDLGRELEDLGNELPQIVPRYISVVGILPPNTIEQVKNIPGIESAESSKDRYHHVVGAFSALRWILRAIMGGICVALLTGLIQLSRMNSLLHRDALVLLKFWGAGKGVMAGPSILSGLSVGLVGGVIAWGGWMTFGIWLGHHIRALSSLLKNMPSIHSHYSFGFFLIGGIIGILAGLMGSLSISELADGGLNA